jgi:hypothetical protein
MSQSLHLKGGVTSTLYGFDSVLVQPLLWPPREARTKLVLQLLANAAVLVEAAQNGAFQLPLLAAAELELLGASAVDIVVDVPGDAEFDADVGVEASLTIDALSSALTLEAEAPTAVLAVDVPAAAALGLPVAADPAFVLDVRAAASFDLEDE